MIFAQEAAGQRSIGSREVQTSSWRALPGKNVGPGRVIFRSALMPKP